MKFLVITGSAHQPGASTLLAEQLAAGAKEAGNDVETIDVGLHPVAPLHYDADNHLIPGDDRIEGLLDKMVSSDILAFATPMHYFGMSAQLKSVVDHMIERDQDLHGDKQAILLATADSDNFDPLKSEFKAIVDHMGWTYAGQVLAAHTYADHLRFYPQIAFELGKSFVASEAV
ncbi:MAG TPA: flavodoxin family protein [Candidatus Limosilactobacillus merdipullorum]|uniref:Flavodoxin family protein n=1 Tax=Candidatus Limosilactobacillus merdipullorum TaxID=2838653 RepID=A0A9D1QN66_9LACO|nr:flavodoxin family protein [Candidatus Limosilactobacillus merdipullorum]